jgi:GT2 family glycosyltransferase
MSNPLVSYLLINYNGGPLLSEALESISRQTVTDHEVIVIDNGSQDKSWDIPYFNRPGWQLERLERNAGFSEANNIAFARSRGSIIALINNDVILDRRWAEKTVAAFEDPEVAAVACRLLQTRNPGFLDSAGFDAYTCCTTESWRELRASHFDKESHKPFGPVASAAAYRRFALERVGLFHSEYFAYYEDTDLAMRLALFGMKCRYLNDAVGYHLGSATGRQYSDFHRYHLRRNVELLYWVNMVGSLVWRHLASHLAYEVFAFIGMLLRGQGSVFWRAKRDAFKMIPWIREQRKLLRERLRTTVGLPSAQRTLQGRLKPFSHAFFRGENIRKV